MDKSINLVKLCVGAEKVEDLLNWQKNPRAKGPDGKPRHVTRMWPKREAEILNGGSIYWGFKGVIPCRQRIERLDEVIGQDGIRRCGVVLNSDVQRTEHAMRRPFQGWRYLTNEDAPADLSAARAREEALPVELSAALAEIGVR